MRNLKVCLLVPLRMLSQLNHLGFRSTVQWGFYLEAMVANEEDHCVLCQTKLSELTQYLQLNFLGQLPLTLPICWSAKLTQA